MSYLEEYNNLYCQKKIILDCFDDFEKVRKICENYEDNSNYENIKSIIDVTSRSCSRKRGKLQKFPSFEECDKNYSRFYEIMGIVNSNKSYVASKMAEYVAELDDLISRNIVVDSELLNFASKFVLATDSLGYEFFRMKLGVRFNAPGNSHFCLADKIKYSSKENLNKRFVSMCVITSSRLGLKEKESLQVILRAKVIAEDSLPEGIIKVEESSHGMNICDATFGNIINLSSGLNEESSSNQKQ